MAHKIPWIFYLFIVVHFFVDSCKLSIDFFPFPHKRVHIQILKTMFLAHNSSLFSLTEPASVGIESISCGSNLNQVLFRYNPGAIQQWTPGTILSAAAGQELAVAICNYGNIRVNTHTISAGYPLVPSIVHNVHDGAKVDFVREGQ
jgi:hypothetical protein